MKFARNSPVKAARRPSRIVTLRGLGAVIGLKIEDGMKWDGRKQNGVCGQLALATSRTTKDSVRGSLEPLSRLDKSVAIKCRDVPTTAHPEHSPPQLAPEFVGVSVKRFLPQSKQRSI